MYPKICIKGMLMIMFASLSVSVMAQERSAAGAVETQMTWAALSSQIEALRMKTTGITMLTDKIVACGKVGKVYAPDQSGVDAQTCLVPPVAKPLVNQVNQTSQQVNQIILCNNAGKQWNGTSCVKVVARAPSCSLDLKEMGQSQPCKSGYSVVSKRTEISQAGGGGDHGNAPDRFSTYLTCARVVCQ